MSKRTILTRNKATRLFSRIKNRKKRIITRKELKEILRRKKLEEIHELMKMGNGKITNIVCSEISSVSAQITRSRDRFLLRILAANCSDEITFERAVQRLKELGAFNSLARLYQKMETKKTKQKILGILESMLNVMMNDYNRLNELNKRERNDQEERAFKIGLRKLGEQIKERKEALLFLRSITKNPQTKEQISYLLIEKKAPEPGKTRTGNPTGNGYLELGDFVEMSG